MVTKTHIDELLWVYEYENIAAYKQFIDSKSRGGEYPDITRQLLLDSLSAGHDIEFIFSKDEMLGWSKSYHDRYITTRNSELNVYKNLLYSCIADVDKVSQKIRLDAGACGQVRQLIERYPCSYLDGFVFPGRASTNPDFNSIACEPFWEQIFGSAGSFEIFINDPARDTCDKIDLVRNFWRLYKRNGFEQLHYEGMGNVQEKINNALRDEIDKLERLEAIDQKYKDAKTTLTDAPEAKTIYHNKLQEMRSEIEGLHIPIKYRTSVQTKITQSLNELGRA